jgi:hypothetical protein
MPQVLARLLVNNDLAMLLAGQVDQRNGIATQNRSIGLGVRLD